MDIMTRKVTRVETPEIKVTVRFNERTHTLKQREAISEEITKLVGKWSRRNRARVQVDLKYV